MKNKENAAQNLQWYQNQSLETQISLFSNFLEVAKLLANQMLEDEEKEKAGIRYEREKPSSGRYSRWDSNPGSIRVGEEKVKIKVPRMLDNQKKATESPESYQKLRSIEYELHLMSDNGSQPISEKYENAASLPGIKHITTSYSNPKGNADTERFMRTFKEEIIYPNEFDSLEEARKAVGDFITFYNQDYPHSALGYLSPIDFEKQSTYKNAV